MNNLALILRKRSDRNVFRTLLLAAFNDKNAHTILLCSGFFQERGTFSASSDIVSSIKCVANCPKKLIIVGHYGYMWKNDFSNFCKSMKGQPCYRVHQRLARKRNWHSKVLIAKDHSSNPIFAIIGSSNLTSNAFGINSKGKFNYESDVVMWNDSDSLARLVTEYLSTTDDESEIYVSKYDSENALNRQIPLDKKINALFDEIITESEEIS